MSTPHSATVYIQNNTGGTALIQMSHKYWNKSIQTGVWKVGPGETGGPLIVDFATGFGTGLDFWYCSAFVQDGPNPGVYVTRGRLNDPTKECELEGADADSVFTNVVDTTSFHINMPSGGCSTGMTRTGPYTPITNVFVLMLENRSFDHIFGFSGIPGINGLTGDESNTFGNTPYKVIGGVEDPMTTDPNHEFLDTLEQLCGTKYGPPPNKNAFPPGPYPHIDNSGFVANYAVFNDEDNKNPTAPDDYGDVMKCCLPDQVPVMVQLAKEFAICDQWYASIPGPTWPNRLFAMAATSSGLDATPDSKTIIKWETIDGFRFVNGSLFHHIAANPPLQYRLYNDFSNQFASNPAPFYEGGGFPIMAALHGVFMTEVDSFASFATDLQGAYPYQFTFIEPNYGDALQDTYRGGSSQHPMDTIAAGEAMIAQTYKAIRNSPHWYTSLLIITYDEHGGFYDHSTTPRPAPPPGDGNPYGYNKFGFDFSSYGVRVPAVIVSPLIAKGTVDHTLYDHTSIAKTVEELYGLPNLTDRDGAATSLVSLLDFDSPPRTDCPHAIDVPAPASPVDAPPIDQAADLSDPTPLKQTGNTMGFLHIAAKTDIELQGGTDAAKATVLARIMAIKTNGQARAYFAEVWTKLEAAKADKS